MFERSPGELTEELSDQRKALRASCDGYDRGELWESKRLATTVYNLVHEDGQKSLLSSLGIKKNLKFISSSKGFNLEYLNLGVVRGGRVSPPTPLAALMLGENETIFVPMCHSVANIEWCRSLAFGKWYEEGVFETSKGRVLSRKNLIYSLRSQDGGAHIDNMIKNEAYFVLRSDADDRLRSSGKPIPHAHYATMRQIAWEVEKTLEFLDRQVV
nr:hypothetical protein [uncultured Sphingomonas sp.]